MTREGTPSLPPTGAPKPSTGLAVLAALLPMLSAFGAMIYQVVASEGPSGWLHLMAEGGFATWLTCLLAAFGALVLAVVLFLCGRGARVPAAIGLFVAALPWLGGLAGMRLGIWRASDAIQFADPASRAMLMAQGIAEASATRFVGTTLSSSLFAGLAMGWGVAAIAQRAPNRKGLLALPFGVAGLLGAVLATALTFAGDGSFLLIFVASIGAAIALGLAGAGAGGDLPHGRAAALAAASGLAAVLAFFAALEASETTGLRNVFGAVANASPEMKATFLARGAAEIVAAKGAAMWGGMLIALTAIGLAAWAFTRAKPSAGRWAGGVALVLVAATTWALDRWVISSVGETMASLTRPPWAAVADFVPAAIESRGRFESVDAIVSPDRVTRVAGGAMAPIPADGTAAPARQQLAELFRQVLPVPEPARPEPEPGSREDIIRRMLDSEQPWGRTEPDRSLVLAVDARIPPRALRAVLDAARDAGADSVVFVGAPPVSPESRAMREQLQDDVPLMANLFDEVTAVRVELQTPALEAAAAADRSLFHGTIGAAPQIPIAARPQGNGTPFVLDTTASVPHRSRWDDDRGADPVRVYLAFGDDATTERIVAALDRVAGIERKQPVVITGAIPGNPAQPVVENPPQVGILGTIGGGSFADILAGGGTGGLGEPGLGQPGGRPTVMGSLPREVIQRVVRRHTAQVRHCYEQALADAPQLEGRVNVRFVIGPDGRVQSASVQDSTLGSAAVESCIAARVRQWEFPAPDGGGVVAVTYPFTFSAGR